MAMVRPEEIGVEAVKELATERSGAPITNILIIIAMQTEAIPLVNKFQLSEDTDQSLFPKGVPWVRYHGTYKDLHINLIWPGKDLVFGVDSVGTVSASLVTYSSLQALKPDLIINAGTAGGFRAKGACVGDVYLASDVAFHDRRIPIPVFDMYGIGARQALFTPNIIKELNLKALGPPATTTAHTLRNVPSPANRIRDLLVIGILARTEITIDHLVIEGPVGKLSTGDSLDMTPQDEASILANDATVKDMEGAAVAYVADLFSVPAIFIKAVTDIVDAEKPTAEEFIENLLAVTAALDKAVSQVIDFICAKCLSYL